MSKELWTTSELVWMAIGMLFGGIALGTYLEEWMCDCPHCAYEKSDHSAPTQENYRG